MGNRSWGKHSILAGPPNEFHAVTNPTNAPPTTLRAFIENEDDSTLWHVLYTVLAELQDVLVRLASRGDHQRKDASAQS